MCAPSPSTANGGFTLIELMVSLVVGLLLVFAAMMLYVPVSRSLLDQAAIAQQTHSEGVGYDFNVINLSNAGFAIAAPTLNTDLVLVANSTTGGVAQNTQVPIPATGSASGVGVFWDWANTPGGPLSCAGIELTPPPQAPLAGSNSHDYSLTYYQEVANGSCTGSYWANAANWNSVTVLPDAYVATGSNPVTVTTGVGCETRDAQFIKPVLHPQVLFNTAIASVLSAGFFAHGSGSTSNVVPSLVCLTNF